MKKIACKGKELELAAPECNALLWWTESSILCAFSTRVRERTVQYSLVQLDPFHTSFGLAEVWLSLKDVMGFFISMC